MTDPLVKPPLWETVSRGLTFEQITQGQATEHKAVREWIRSHYTRRYIPEDVLEALGYKEPMKWTSR